jgi:hypothetical protein
MVQDPAILTNLPPPKTAAPPQVHARVRPRPVTGRVSRPTDQVIPSATVHEPRQSSIDLLQTDIDPMSIEIGHGYWRRPHVN